MNEFQKKVLAALMGAGISVGSALTAINVTIPSEGYRNVVYADPVGLPTVCIGHMDKSLKLGQKFSEDQCIDMFAKDWKKHQDALDKLVKVPYISEWERGALTDFTFNVGVGSVASSTLIRLLNQGDHDAACDQLSRWVYANGKKLKGLVTRRDLDYKYCMGEIPYDVQQAYTKYLEYYNKSE